MRLLLAVLIAFLPVPVLRVWAYRLLLGYKLGKGARVSFLTVLHGRDVRLGRGARINGIGNVFVRVNNLILEDYAKMGSPLVGLNFVSGNGTGTLRLKHAARITWGHFFDLTSDITIGSMTVIGGKGCEFWTHDMCYGKRAEPIVVGDACYVCSAAKFSMGAVVPDNCIVAMGAVVGKAFEQKGVVLGGVPAKVIRVGHNYDARHTYESLGLPF